MSYCNLNEFPNAQNEYVCWVDIMGTRSLMSESVRTSATFIYKLHAEILDNLLPDIKAYPLMDGAYITSANQKSILHLLRNVFISTARDFCSADEPKFQYFIKGSLAYGPIIHGKDIPNKVNDIFASHKNYKESILMGLPMIQAYKHETEVPPFGIFVDESARAFSPNKSEPLHFKWWKWFVAGQDGITPYMNWSESDSKTLIEQGNKYYDYARKHATEIDYAPERINVHCNLFNEYFL